MRRYYVSDIDIVITYIFDKLLIVCSYISYCYNIMKCTITSMLLLCYKIMSYYISYFQLCYQKAVGRSCTAGNGFNKKKKKINK